MYKLNNKEISKKEVDDLIKDLAEFPFDAEDYSLEIKERIKKYNSILEEKKELKIAESLTIFKID